MAEVYIQYENLIIFMNGGWCFGVVDDKNYVIFKKSHNKSLLESLKILRLYLTIMVKYLHFVDIFILPMHVFC